MKNAWRQWLSPTAILAMFLVVLPWQTRYIFGLSLLSGSSTQFGILSLYATQVALILGLCGAYVLHGWPQIEPRYRISMKLAAGLWVVAFVSSLLAQQSIPALAAMIDLSFAGVLFLALLDRRVELQTIMVAFAIGLVVPVILGLIQVVGGGSGASTLLGLAPRAAEQLGDAVWIMGDGTRVLRAYGSFPHPNIFGGYLAVGVLSALLVAGSYGRVWGGMLITVLVIGLLATASRSAVLGLLLGGGLTMLVLHMKSVELTRKLVMPIAATVVVLALGATVFAPSLVASLRGGGALEERSLSERATQYHEWPATLRGVDWLIGNGPRSYVFTLAEVHPDRGVWEYQPIHNVPLLVLSELGLLGLLFVMAWIVTLDRQNFAQFPKREAAYAHGMGKVLFVIIFFDHYFWSSWAGLALVAYVAVVMLRSGEDSTKA